MTSLSFFLCSVGEESTCNAGDPGSIPGLGRSAGEGIGYAHQYSWASLASRLVKNPPAIQETCVRSLGWEDPLEKGKATHSSILAWTVPWTVWSMGSQRARPYWVTFTFTSHLLCQALNTELCSLRLFGFVFKGFPTWTIFKVFTESCSKIASVLSFVLLAQKHAASQLPNQGSNLHPLSWKEKSTTGPPARSLHIALCIG